MVSLNSIGIQSLVKLPIKRRDLVLINTISRMEHEVDRQQTRPVIYSLLNKTPNVSQLYK
ncbi:hypothetical protein [Escherichia coli]|uniref:hypothetical protein n=1 Tax=Escherichia coli TaxID=562 RepID=UPI0014855926|nr:hypothetical protein [Escherichia coli]HDV7651520.1 hypothetical protein [Escherichia coli]HEO1181609.1 hypothetical protein [Escherichia coli]